MIYANAEYTERPTTVWIERLPDATNVWMTKNAEEVGRGQGAEQMTAFVADTAFFKTDENVTAEEIVEAFDDWWQYAESWTGEQEQTTLEQRIDDVEAALLSMMGF